MKNWKTSKENSVGESVKKPVKSTVDNNRLTEIVQTHIHTEEKRTLKRRWILAARENSLRKFQWREERGSILETKSQGKEDCSESAQSRPKTCENTEEGSEQLCEEVWEWEGGGGSTSHGEQKSAFGRGGWAASS